ncbi:MAG: hypothetical protein ACI9EF_001085 [Pseudohongiellaceae bacterium]
MAQFFPFIAFAALLLIGYFCGSVLERRHFAALEEAERETREMVLITFPNAPSEWQVHDPTLVHGSVVISLDYFKRFLAGLKAMVGGRITAYEPLLDRARREALIRLKFAARAQGYDTVVNVRLETSCLASSRGDANGVAGIEILAFGTAVHRGA